MHRASARCTQLAPPLVSTRKDKYMYKCEMCGTDSAVSVTVDGSYETMLCVPCLSDLREQVGVEVNEGAY